MFRLLHSSDLHIGKRFGHLPDDIRGRLREARHGALARLADAARQGGVSAVLLAGDTFDTETPTPAMLHQALAAMADHPDLVWIILPGNHDSLLADELWAAARGALPPNVRLAATPEPIALTPNVVLLPAPCTTRRPGRDLTEWMGTAATPEGMLRIGLAHGPVQDFSEDGAGTDIIAPDRPERAGLDYLALGDWHGQVRIGPRAWYSGTPEPDRFKHDRAGHALLVSIAGPGAQPEVTPVETGRFLWTTRELALLGDEVMADALGSVLPASGRRDILLRLMVGGRARIAARTELSAIFDTLAPHFAHAEMEASGLVTLCETTDLDLIDRAGALRQAAEDLRTAGEDGAAPAADRDIAREALVRLFTYCQAIETA
ncbi:metallophosphoesterase [Ancylobacter sp. 6x-1]|uniref:Metallophosphoesterase n=1 Tax=Ancylobacter crimeensis TaxID=2579147 RepID=A0ABT0DAH3_9HYPH|nr:metallophosphoesterase [Ancylobacter crimeensis]MCK0196957.1 metallophosphoesterase [Ancylobacter crimeensis]